jgi:hypothetical protein
MRFIAIAAFMAGSHSWGIAQHVFLQFDIGYGLSAGTQLINTKTSGSNVEGVYGSFGEGYRFGAAVGYNINQIVALEIGALYLAGKAFESGSPNIPVEHSGQGWLITPGMLLSIKKGATIPYAKFNLVAGFLTVTTEVQQRSPRINETIEENGGIAIGYRGGIGLQFESDNPVSYFIEVSLTSVTYRPSQVEVTALSVNGIDQLNSLQIKKYDYKDSYETVSNTTILGVREPFSNVCGVVGIRFNL